MLKMARLQSWVERTVMQYSAIETIAEKNIHPVILAQFC